MKPIKRGRGTRLALAALGAVGGLAIFAGVAGATDPTISGTVSITGGTLSMPTWPGQVTFPSFKLDGLTHTLEDNDTLSPHDGTFEVQDYTGSGSGWKITAQVGDFTCASPSPCSTQRTLPASTTLVTNGGTDSTTATSPSVACESGDSADCTTGTSTATRVPITIGTGTFTIFDQPVDSGMGDIKVSGLNWWLTVPPTAYAGDYTSTITLGIATGP